MDDPHVGTGAVLEQGRGRGVRARMGLGTVLERSEEYAARIDARLGTIAVGDPLDGAPEPLKSAPATKDGRRLDRTKDGRKKPAGRPRKRAAGAERRTKKAVTDRDGRLF